jgi:hypothetical protein
MFTIRLEKYQKTVPEGGPCAPEAYSIRHATTVHVRYEADGRRVMQLGDAPGETVEVTVGGRPDCAYDVAYVMNEAGKTVDKIS